MKRLIFLAFLAVFSLGRGYAQYTPANAHSHNDYLQSQPFYAAYQHGFGSVEADVFLKNDSLFVAHEFHEITGDRTFERLYLLPLVEACSDNGGKVYPNATLQLLIDLKTGYATTLPALVKLLEPHRAYLYPQGIVKVVISGNTPPPATFHDYPDYIFFDGRPQMIYTAKQLEKIGLISQSFRNYSKWNGQGVPSDAEITVLTEVVNQAHALGKSFRFWATPDLPDAWNFLMQIKADYLNTDKISELGEFLRKSP